MGEAPRHSGGSDGTPAGASVHAEDFGMDGPRGPVFGGVHFDAPPGSLIAIQGPSGSGRTCLLLALTGRMKATAGRAVVGGRRLPRESAAVRRISTLGAVPGVTDPEPALSVAEQLREQLLLQRRFGSPLRSLLTSPARRAAASRARLDAVLRDVNLDLESLPKGPRTRVRDLDRLELLQLSVAGALLGRPRLLAVDDVDLKLTEEERTAAWELLRSVAASGPTVLAVCSRAPAGALVVRTAAAPGEPGDGASGTHEDGADDQGDQDGADDKGRKDQKEETADAVA